MAQYFSPEEARALYGILRKVDFLSGITVDEIDGLIAKFDRKPFKKGKDIIRQGHAGEGLFVIKSGSCSVWKKRGLFGREKIAALKAGDFFGEMSLVYDNPVSATVTTLETSEIYLYSKKDFSELVSRNTGLREHLRRMADKRTSENVLGK